MFVSHSPHDVRKRPRYDPFNQIGFIRNLKDYTQIFSQFALGAAAINVLR